MCELVRSALDRQMRSCPVRNSGDSLFTEGKCASIILTFQAQNKLNKILICQVMHEHLLVIQARRWRID